MSIESLEELELRKVLRDSPSLQAGEGDGVVCGRGGVDEGKVEKKKPKKSFISSLPFSHSYLPSLAQGLSHHTHPTLVIGVQSDTLFPIEQQRELAECLKENGNDKVVYYELNQPWGHDTFLLDVENVGGAVKGFLERESS